MRLSLSTPLECVAIQCHSGLQARMPLNAIKNRRKQHNTKKIIGAKRQPTRQSESRGQTCLHYAELQGGKACEAGLSRPFLKGGLEGM